MNIDKKSDGRFGSFEIMNIQGTTLLVPQPIPLPNEPFIGREYLVERALSAWFTFDGSPPLNFRLYGPPGTGKNALVYELARSLKKDLYIISGDEDVHAEDIACTPVMKSGQNIHYVASGLTAAMIRGNSIAFFDEIAKAPAASLATLAPVLDSRRTLASVTAGITIQAAPGFLFCAALNENEEKGRGLPDYIDERTRPAIHVGIPTLHEMQVILTHRIEGSSDLWIKCFLARYKDCGLSPRNAMTLINNARKLYEIKKRNGGAPELNRATVTMYLKNVEDGFPVERLLTDPQRQESTTHIEEKVDDILDTIGKERSGPVH